MPFDAYTVISTGVATLFRHIFFAAMLDAIAASIMLR